MSARIAALVWLILGGGAGCKFGSDPAPVDSSAGKATCLDIRNCVRDNCSAGADQQCVQDCIASGDAVSQSRYRNLTSCLVNICCTDTGGCGGGDPRCSALGTPACDMCNCQAQCGGNPKGQPCRYAATQCYGIEPDCSMCPK